MAIKKRHAEVAGGGFAGLVAAAALAQRGWSVTLHEMGSDLRALGAGIFMWENGLRVLENVGAFDEVMANSVTPNFYETRVHDVTVSKEMFAGHRWRTMERAVLHAALVNAAKRSGVKILTNSEVVAASADGTITLKDGSVRKADLVVGADGVASQVRDSMGFKYVNTVSRDAIARVLVERDPEHVGGAWDNVIDSWHFAPRTMRILYVPVNPRFLYLGLMAPVDDLEASEIPIKLDAWAEMFPRMLPALKRVANMKHARRDQYQTNVLDRWTEGRVAVIGDAAHAMCPALAQGAGCGMVNALTLAEIASNADDIEAILPQWEAHVRPTTNDCQDRSAWFAETRAMSRGYQFTARIMETANTDPLALARALPSQSALKLKTA